MIETQHTDKPVFVINFSGGKDSSIMLFRLCTTMPDAEKHIVWADTGWEHKGTEEWCRALIKIICTAARHKLLPLNVVRSSTKDFFSMVRGRGKFPSPQQRQCTSDLKRGPIQKWIRNNVTSNQVINCMGLRAAESSARAKQPQRKINKTLSNGKRTVIDWLPIQDLSDKEVYGGLEDASIPLHPVYQYLSRFSCQVCIFAGPRELATIEQHNPEAIAKISAVEEEIGFTLGFKGSVRELIDEYNSGDA